MKIRKSNGEWFWVNFKYEHVPTFCFICGLLGHAEKLCSKIFDTPMNEIAKPYGQWMRALPRRQSYLTGSKWLRSEAPTQVAMADAVGSKKSQGGWKKMGKKSGIVDNPDAQKGVTVKDNVFFGNQEPTLQKEGKAAKVLVPENLNDADMVELDSGLDYVDPKRKRPNEEVVTNPNNAHCGLSKTCRWQTSRGGSA